MASASGKELHKWTVEQTKALIKFRADNEDQFTKKKFASKQLWETVVKERGLEGKITGQQTSKKWKNLKMKYKQLKTPKTGSGTADGEQTASNWKFYEDMHTVLGGRPSIDSPVLVASFDNPDPTKLLMVIVEPSMEEPGPSSPTTPATPTPTYTPSTPAAPSAASTPAPQAPTTPSPRKRARRNNNAVLDFFKQESLNEQKRHEETKAKTERFLSLFEKLVEKMP